jgi:tetratricopeptide (TPR) repeat protein
MKPSRPVTLIAASLLTVCLAISAGLVHFMDRLHPQGTIEDVLYLKSSQLRWMSLGYTGLVADIYWTRAVQYYGGEHSGDDAPHYELLAPLLNITTDLDPKLTVAYEYGAAFLAPKPRTGAGLPKEAVALVEKGIRANPDNWHLYYSLGFLHYMELKDYEGAANAFLRGSRVPNAHPWLTVLAGKMAQKANDLQTARMLWTATYDTTQDASIRENAAQHLIAIQVAEDVTGLEKTVDLYHAKVGQLPTTFRDLAAARLVAVIPTDPFGQTYVLNSDGTVEVRHPEKFGFLEKGAPKGYLPPLSRKN